MARTACAELVALLDDLNERCKKVNAPATLLNMGFSSAGAIIGRIDNLAREAVEEISIAPFRQEERRQSRVDLVIAARDETVSRLFSFGGGGKTGSIISDTQLEKLRAAAEDLDEKGMAIPGIGSRVDRIAATEELIEEVKSWKLNEYARSALILQLTTVVRVIQAEDMYSESDIRARVKSIIADFRSEYRKMDREHQSYLERLQEWTKTAGCVGVFALALTADTSQVAGLISPPAKQITNQSFEDK